MAPGPVGVVGNMIDQLVRKQENAGRWVFFLIVVRTVIMIGVLRAS